jgi:16S rRNA (guanine527-N7)-methyltransferase
MNVSRETQDRLRVFSELLEKWNPKINLVSKASLVELWDRHIADSIQVLDAAPKAMTWVDLGSGGGFPGLIGAICAKDIGFTLIESDSRKCAFLREAARQTGTDVTILNTRIEAAPVQSAGVVSARALAELEQLLGYAARHMAPGGIALFQKGATWKKELEAAQRRWRFDFEAITSKTEAQSVILRIQGVSRV